MKSPARRAFIFLSASVLLLSVSADLIVPEVYTALGSLRGEYVSVKGTEAGVHAFLGVPFAKPPVGPALRLSAPQPVQGWNGMRDATKQPPMCIQNKQLVVDLMKHLADMVAADIPEVSEDCLYLNVYTPANRAEDSKLPVMVWIHGGGFTIGSASSYDGSALAAYQDVVVVLIQYRLGLLGFLSTGDEHMSGNFGLLDQVEALRWIKQHIHSFGGDPDSVTIFGESAGGVSVSLLLLSPLSEGLFHRAIAESGTAAMDLLVMNDPLPATQIIANISGCSSYHTEKLSECMKNLDLDTILKIAEDAQLRYPLNVDGHFLKKTADELLRTHELLTVPFMTGVTNHEGGFLLVDFFAPKNWTEGLDLEHVKNMISMFYPDSIITDVMIQEYMGKGEDRVKNRDAYTELLGDVIFTIPAIKAANAHRDAGAPVYLYEYQHPPSILKAKRPSFVKADHGDEILLALGLCFTTKHVTLTEDACTEEEKQLSKTVMSYWTNFARTGSPNGEGLAHWPKYGAEEHYLKIDLKEQLIDQHLKRDRFIFMTQTLPEKIKQQKERMEKLPVVHTALGSLRGDFVSVKGTETEVHAFLGVPFAKPPVGPTLRYSAPQPVEGWNGVRDATKQPIMCIQRRESTLELFKKLSGFNAEIPGISEDCLYLNIYTPANRADDAKLPVMVWIHGGGFAIGSASMFDGSALAAYHDMVVVLVQYRLGLLGFLSTGDEHMSGNFGLLDQVEALRWIKQHIHSFGGDPDSVTIFGESAGGASVSVLLLSPLSEGLFHRAIAESGSAGMDFLFANDPLPMTQMIANISGCSIDSTEKLSECMKNLDLDTILTVVQDETIRYFLNVDGHFLTKPVEELFQNHELHTVPFMTGANNDEGGFLLVDFLLPKNWTEGVDLELIKNMLFMFFPDSVMTDLVTEEYMGKGEDRVRNRDAYTELLGDIFFSIPAIKTANAHRDAGAPVYLYEFRHPPIFLQAQRPSFVKADHGDEIFSVLGYCFTTKHVTLTEACHEEEKQLSKTMMSYWANFARTGSPNGEGLVHWPKYGAEEGYLSIDLKEQWTDQHLKGDRFIFLTQTLPEKMKQHKEKMEKLLVVHTALGSLRGEYVSVKGTEAGVHAFLGVPFAKPPVGLGLRLSAPQPVEGWNGVRDATKQPPMCIQDRSVTTDLMKHFAVTLADIPEVSEDCLYLNVYTPSNRAEDSKLPVMVWIHGGGFTLGSASTYDGSALAAYQDVVVVLVQYRLGLLGFLSTGDEHISGNFGLLDQVEALRWIKQHIHSFGGDPDSVTIFGESAGGVSVSVLLLSPLSEGLFHRAIAESGTAAMDLLVMNDPLPATQIIANISGCSSDRTDKLSECMKNLDLDTILSIAQDRTLRYPVNVDGHFLTKPVDELFRKHELHTVPFMTGANNDEGGFLLGHFFAPENWTEGLDLEKLKNMLSMFYPDPIILGLVIEEYMGTGEDRVRNRNGYTELLGDMIFIIPAIKAANAHRDAGAPVYLYEFQHAPSFMKALRPSFVKSDHGDEISSVLGYCFTTKHVTLTEACHEEEEQLSKTMMSYWANFARTGSPNGEGLTHWPKYEAEERYLKIDLKEQWTAQHLKRDQFIFMTKTLPEKTKQQKEKMEHSEL